MPHLHIQYSPEWGEGGGGMEIVNIRIPIYNSFLLFFQAEVVDIYVTLLLELDVIK